MFSDMYMTVCMSIKRSAILMLGQYLQPKTVAVYSLLYSEQSDDQSIPFVVPFPVFL